MLKNNTKTILGVLSLLVFLSIFISIGGGFNKIENSLYSFYTNSVTPLLQGDKGAYSGPGIFKQQVVQEESSIIDVVDKVSPAVVSVVVKTTNFDFFSGPTSSKSGIGTGFIVDKNGLIVTNSHVVDSVDGQYSVVLKDGTTYEVQKIHLDEGSDLAILEINARNLPTVTLGDSDSIKVGQSAIAIGNALGRFSNTVTSGLVSGIARQLTASSGFGGDSKTYENAIQTDAALNPGNSGGPLLNSAGQVIGINVAVTQDAQNIGFAIPVNTLKPILENFLVEGRIVKPYLGVSYQMITPELATINNLPAGAYISTVLPDSPAKKAGLQRGDVIIKVEGKDFNGETSLSSIISSKKVGDRLSLVVDRDGKKVNITAVLEETPQNQSN